MCQKVRKERITKKEFYDRGGFANSALFRQQSRGGAWRYYVSLDRQEPEAEHDDRCDAFYGLGACTCARAAA